MIVRELGRPLSADELAILELERRADRELRDELAQLLERANVAIAAADQVLEDPAP